MWEEIFHIGKDIVGGVAKGDPGMQIFLGILVAVGGMLAKPFFEWLAQKNRPLAGTILFILLVFFIYMLISTWDYASESHSKTEAPSAENTNTEDPPQKAVDSSVFKPETSTEPTTVTSTDTATGTSN